MCVIICRKDSAFKEFVEISTPIFSDRVAKMPEPDGSESPWLELSIFHENDEKIGVPEEWLVSESMCLLAQIHHL